MLVSLKEILKNTRTQKYAVGLFDVVTVSMARAVIDAAEALQAPVLIGTAEILLDACSLEDAASFLIPMAKKASVPVGVHFDHGYDTDLIQKAIELGFTSVMYDCSALSFEKNKERCAKLIQFAHKKGVSVETELGHVGTQEQEDDGNLYTDPEQARQFIEETQADALAVSIGTSHGAYCQPPKLDISRLSLIAEKVETPLVLHGGSGLSDEDFRATIQAGCSKMNIWTDLNVAAFSGATEYLKAKKGIWNFLPKSRQAVQAVAEEKIRLFGAVGKA